MKKVMFLGLVLSVVSLGSVMANDAYAPLDGKPKKVVINVNMPPAGGPVEHFNPGGCPPPPPKCNCNCNHYAPKGHKGGSKFHKAGGCHHNAPKPRPGKPIGGPGGPGGPGGNPGGGPGGPGGRR